MKKKQPKAGNLFFAVLFGLLLLLGVSILSLSVWYRQNLDVSFKELLYTLLSPLKGTGEGTVRQIVGAALAYVIAGGVLYALLAVPLFRRRPCGRFFRDLRLKRENPFLYRIEREDWEKNDERRPLLYARQKSGADSSGRQSFCFSFSHSRLR